MNIQTCVRACAVVMVVLVVGTSSFAQSVPPEAERVITGTTVLTAPQIFQAKRLRFAPGARIVTDGHTLTLQANEIAADDHAKIVSFEGETKAAAGAPGRAAGTVIIVAGSITSGLLEIDNHGETGGVGLLGTDGPTGPRGEPGAPREWNPLQGCGGGRNGGPGGQGGVGGDGGPGGQGGNGGLVLTSVLPVAEGPSRLRISARPGQGGRGGPPGRGGPGGSGGEGASGTATCGGTGPGPQGPDGLEGGRGQDGPEGQEGRVLDLRGAIAPCLSAAAE